MKRVLALLLLAACGKPAAKPAPPPDVAPVAKKAADFTLNDSDGQPVALHDLLKKGPVILAFYPKAFTGG